MAPALPARIGSLRKPFASVPGSLIGTWPALVGLGFAAGLAVQFQLIAGAGINPWIVLGLTFAAAIVGLVGARLWFLVRDRKGWTAALTGDLGIQGFIAGAIVLLAAGIFALHLPIGIVADDTAPALFLGIAVGRPGCFLTGCCAGRPTASRWGLWASDRKTGARRIPIQLWEAMLGLALGFVTIYFDLQRTINVHGAIALGGLAAYTLGRQVLFGYRSEPRRSRIARPSMFAVAGTVLAGDVFCWVVTCIGTL